MALDPLLSLPNGEQHFPLSFTPDFEIAQVNGNGLVVRCSRSFEWGATLQLGVVLHIQLPTGSLEESGNEGDEVCDTGDSVIDFRGIVVDCHEVISYPAAKPQFEITLFFDSITEEQCAALIQASGNRGDIDTSPSFGDSLDFPGGFDRVCSLN